MAKSKHPDDVMYALMQELRANSAAVATYSQTVAGLAAEVKNLTAEVSEISQVVYRGNGHSLMSRTALIEQRLDELDEQDNKGIASHQWRWLVLAGLLPGLAGLAVGILSLIY